MEILTFSLDSHQFGVEVTAVAEVVRAVAIAPLPGAPEVVAGAINVRGDVLPVLNARRRFGLPAKQLQPSDMFILTEQDALRVALHVDRVGWPVEVAVGESTPVPTLVGHTPYVKGLLRTPDGLLVIHDVAAFLNSAEIAELKRALHDLPGERV